MFKSNLQKTIDLIVSGVGTKSPVVVKDFYIGKNSLINATIIYSPPLVDKTIIDRDILSPLMLNVDETIIPGKNIAEFLSKKYITVSYSSVEIDPNKAIESINSGKTVILIENTSDFIIADTTGGFQRSIMDPPNESSIKGPREGFVESLEANIGIIKRTIKDNNLTIENLTLGRRSQTDTAIVYISDIADKDVLNELKKRLKAIDVDAINDIGMLEQFIEDSTYSIFPQIHGSERPDIIKAALMEGRIAVLLNGASFVLIVPSLFTDFFQGIEDYSERTLNSSFIRILRIIAIFLVTTLQSIYLTLINFNAELIPVKLISTIVQSRSVIYLTPFLEIVFMEMVVEFLREGGLRLPPRIATTLSIVGGIIIGNAALAAKVVSPATVLVVGMSAISTFLIPNYEMSLSIRFVRFPMLILTNALGFLGIIAVWFFLIIHISSLKIFNVQYFAIYKDDIKDIFVRAPLWKMNKRPEAIPNNNPIRQKDFWYKFRRKKNE
jgi:spore germination protein KA